MDIGALATKLGITDDDFTDALAWGTTGDGYDSTWFTARGGRTVVRGGGLGNDSYCARVVGTDPQWGFQREFSDTDKNLSRSGASGVVTFGYEGDGLYSYGRVTISSTNVKTGFFLVLDGKIADLGNKRATILKALAALETEVTA